MMNSTLKYTSLLIMLGTLSGCALFSKQHVIYDRDQDYLKANSTPPLVIPPGVDSSQLGNKYPVPGTQYPPYGQPQSMVPPGSLAEQQLLHPAPNNAVPNAGQNTQQPILPSTGVNPALSNNMNAGANALEANQQNMLTGKKGVIQAGGAINSATNTQSGNAAGTASGTQILGGTYKSPVVPRSVGGNAQTPVQPNNSSGSTTGTGISSTPNLSLNTPQTNQRGVVTGAQISNVSMVANGNNGATINSSENLNTNVNARNTYAANSYDSGNVNSVGNSTTATANQSIIVGQLATLNQNQSSAVGSDFSHYPYLIEQQSINQVWPNMAPALQTAGYRIMVQDRKVNTYYFLDLSATNGRVTTSTPLYQIHAASTARGNTSLIVTDNSGKPIDIGTAKVVLENVQYGLEGKRPPILNQVKSWVGL